MIVFVSGSQLDRDLIEVTETESDFPHEFRVKEEQNNDVDGE